jgi:hypothetical protein
VAPKAGGYQILIRNKRDVEILDRSAPPHLAADDGKGHIACAARCRFLHLKNEAASVKHLGFQLAQVMEISSCGGDLAAPPGASGMFSKSYPATPSVADLDSPLRWRLSDTRIADDILPSRLGL